MSVTRLLVLGAVRIFQPTHGYFVRRELTTWQVAEWAHLNPGSVYNALRVLTREGMLAEEMEAGETAPASSSSRSRTLYRLTPDGEQEFQRLVREALWRLHPYEPEWLLAGLSFWPALSRDEVVAGLEARADMLRGRLASSTFIAAELPRVTPGTPDHIVEHIHFHGAQLRGELEWTVDAVRRIRAGEYRFRGEDPVNSQV